MKRKTFKIALITSLVFLFIVTLFPMFNPVMSVIKQLIGSVMIGWWTGASIVKIWYK